MSGPPVVPVPCPSGLRTLFRGGPNPGLMGRSWGGAGVACAAILMLVTIGLAGCTAGTSFGDPVFAEDAQDFEPVNASTSFDSGIPEVHVVGSYENLEPDDGITYRWLHDGQAFFEETTTARRLGGFEETGSGEYTFFLEIQGGWPPGEYGFELVHEGSVVSEGGFTVGEGAGFGPVYVGTRMDDTGTLQGVTSSFDVGEPAFTAAVRNPSLGTGDRMSVQVSVQDVPLSQEEETKARFQASGPTAPISPLTYRWTWQGGLPPGQYDVTFQDEDGHRSTGSFTVGDGRGVGTLVFGSGRDGAAITGTDDTFPSSIDTIYVGTDIVGYPAETMREGVWKHNGSVQASANRTLGDIHEGWGYESYQPFVSDVLTISSEDWDAGVHTFEIYLDGELHRTGSFVIAESSGP